MKRLALPLIFIGIPLIEIALFVVVGERIGILWTIVIVIATAIAGTTLLRMQGTGALANARNAMESGNFPVESVADGVFLLIAGILLLTPGFLTDFVGFLLFIPGLRHSFGRLIWQKLVASGKIDIQTGGPLPENYSEGPVIEGEIIDEASFQDDNIDSEGTPATQNSESSENDSPWRNH